MHTWPSKISSAVYLCILNYKKSIKSEVGGLTRHDTVDRAGGESCFLCQNGFLDPEMVVEARGWQAGGPATVCVLGHLYLWLKVGLSKLTYLHNKLSRSKKAVTIKNLPFQITTFKNFIFFCFILFKAENSVWNHMHFFLKWFCFKHHVELRQKESIQLLLVFELPCFQLNCTKSSYQENYAHH